MKGRIVIVCFVWLTILGIGVGTWKLFIIPAREFTQETAKKAAQEKAEQTKQAEQESYLNPSDEWAVKLQPKLKDEDWSKLIIVNTLQVPPVVFPRGVANVTEQSEITLTELIEKLKKWPQYYILIKGNASLQGDVESNKILATNRADAVLHYLINHGINLNRAKVVSVEPTRSTDVVIQLGIMAVN